MEISGGFVSGRRLSDGKNSAKSNAHVARPTLVIIALAFLSSTYTFANIGADAYKAKCAACHGASGAADTMLGKNMKLRRLDSAEVQEQSDDELTAIISKGKKRMPRYDDKLSPAQIRAVVEYIRSLKH